MRLFSYLFLIVQILYFQDVVAQKTKDDSSKFGSVKWQSVEEKSKPLKKINWKSYKNDQIYFDNKIEPGSTINKKKLS